MAARTNRRTPAANRQSGVPDQWLLDPIQVPIDGSVPYRLDRDLLVPRQPGVYLIHDLRGVLYIGRTRNLRERFNDHYWRPANPRIAAALAQPIGDLRFSWSRIGVPDQIALERRLIHYFNPPCNRLQYVAHRLACDRRA